LNISTCLRKEAKSFSSAFEAGLNRCSAFAASRMLSFANASVALPSASVAQHSSPPIRVGRLLRNAAPPELGATETRHFLFQHSPSNPASRGPIVENEHVSRPHAKSTSKPMLARPPNSSILDIPLDQIPNAFDQSLKETRFFYAD
jgi:hypothetical protein